MSKIINIGSDDNKSQQSARQINVNLNSAPELHCLECNSIFFQEVTFFKKLSALISPTGQDAIIPITTYTCVECGAIASELLPIGFSTGDDNGENIV